MNYRTWLIWDRQTARLMLEVNHVPAHLGKQTVTVGVAANELWPLIVSEDGVENEYIQVDVSVSAPVTIRKQMKAGSQHRKVEWGDAVLPSQNRVPLKKGWKYAVSVPFALCPLPFALCPSATCPMPFAPCPAATM